MRYKLGEICEIVSGSTPQTSIPEYWDGNEKWITPAEISNDTYIVEDSVRHITELGAKKTGLMPFPKGTVILSSRAPIGKVAIAGCEMYCNQGFKNLICSDLICNRYLYWFLKGKTDYLNSLGRGATFKEISKQIVSSIEINVPDLQTQEEISRIFETVTNIIHIRQSQLQCLDDLVKARFVEMFGDVDDRRTIADICSIITDGTHQPPKFTQNGIPFLFVSNIVTNEITYNAEKFISEETYDELYKRTPIEIGDIVLSTVGSYGHAAVVKSDRKFLFQRHIAYLKPISSVINSIYLHSAILSNDAQRQIDERVKGIAQKTLNLSEIRKITVPVPPLALQEQFATFVEQTDKSKLAVKQVLEKAETLKKALMQEYFG